MERGNVLVIGNSGVGKSTLVNAVLGQELAKTGGGTTDKLELYQPENEEVPFRIIDTIGFQPGLFRQRAIQAVKQWSRECTRKGKEGTQVNVIWFCIDGTSRKLFPETIKHFAKIASIWSSVPVIAVITKSYSTPQREQNIQMVYDAFSSQKKQGANLRRVIPVVAAPYVLDENTFVAPEGIAELIDATNSLMPEGVQVSQKDLSRFILNRKRVFAQGVVAAATAAGAAVGAIPIPFSDAMLLTPTEVAEINAIAKIYGIGKNENSKRLLNSIIEVGTVSAAAKTLISTLKAIPGLNLGASVLNAVIAGVIIAGLGEGSIYAFEQIYLGNKSTQDIDWIRKLLTARLSLTIVEKAKPILSNLKDTSDKKAVLKAVLELLATVVGKSEDHT